MVVARVILKKAQSYKIGGRRWLKDVPHTLKGSELAEYVNNGYFSVTFIKGSLEDLQEKAEKKATAVVKHHEKVKTKVVDEEDEEAVMPKKAVGLKKRKP